MIEKEIEKSVKNNLVYFCGIDIGEKNIAISFIDTEKNIVSYHGSPSIMYRYEIDKDVVIIECPKKTQYPENLISILYAIKEFNNSVKIFIEKQPGIASREMCRMDGVIFGFISRHVKICEYIDPRTRISFAEKKINNFTSEITDSIIVPKSIKKTKVSSYIFVKGAFPKFYDYICAEADKSDDILDAVIYAFIAFESAGKK